MRSTLVGDGFLDVEKTWISPWNSYESYVNLRGRYLSSRQTWLHSLTGFLRKSDMKDIHIVSEYNMKIIHDVILIYEDCDTRSSELSEKPHFESRKFPVIGRGVRLHLRNRKFQADDWAITLKDKRY